MIKTVLNVDGMMCGMCEAHMNDAIRNNFKVKKVSSSHKKGTTEVVSEESLNPEVLKSVISEMGYELKDISEEEYKKKGLFSK
ncbi:MAG: cation transporter [Lachnospiraceae bacterium]|nr:cation transporter [Lachnospiraceae bacterium]